MHSCPMPLSFPSTEVGQVFNLRPIFNRPGRQCDGLAPFRRLSRLYRLSNWPFASGGQAGSKPAAGSKTLSGVALRGDRGLRSSAARQPARPVGNRPQDGILHHVGALFASFDEPEASCDRLKTCPTKTGGIGQASLHHDYLGFEDPIIFS